MSHEHSGKTTKPEQALKLDPPCELHFKGPYDEVTSSYLMLTNPTDKIIGFKVKTTAPKTYCVRPNGGIVKPNKTTSVAVMLQPFDPENDDRSRDKFMVQSAFLPSGETTYYDGLWQDVPPEGLMNSKLKCIFDIPIADPPAPVVITSEAIVTTPPDSTDQPKPKVKTVHIQEAKNIDSEAEAKKFHEELRKLKAEWNALRLENSLLKEEGLRSRIAQDALFRTTTARPAESESRNVPNKQAVLTSNYLVIYAVVALLIGIFIGKVIF